VIPKKVSSIKNVTRTSSLNQLNFWQLFTQVLSIIFVRTFPLSQHTRQYWTSISEENHTAIARRSKWNQESTTTEWTHRTPSKWRAKRLEDYSSKNK